MINGISKYLFLIIFIGILAGCRSKRDLVYTDTVTIPDEVWTLDKVAQFQVSVNDTVSNNNILFSIRTGTSYPFRNIWLFVTTISPLGISITDTLQYMIADEKGEWYGKGFGNIHELDLPFKTNVYFPVKGIYTFSIRHGMRAENLRGVYDLGLRVEKTAN
jgi:gliding motility-associated lipoprotein GldH